MEIIVILWPIIGIFCAFASTPSWMFKSDPFGIFLAIFCGAFAGPIGIVWFFTSDGIRGDRDRR